MIKKLACDNKYLLLCIVIINLVFAFGSFPYDQILYDHSKILHPADFDSQNLFGWQYYKSIGGIPYIDFWYPYAGRYFLIQPFYPDIIISWLLRCALLLFSSIATISLFDFSIKKYLVFVSGVVLLYANGHYYIVDRYFPPIVMIALICAFVYRKSILLSILAAFWTVVTFLLEPNNSLIAFSSLVIPVALFIFNKWKYHSKEFINTLFVFAIIVIAGIAAVLLALLANGMFYNAIEFYKNIGDMSVYISWPIDRTLYNKLNIDSVYVYGLASLLAFVSYEFINNKQSSPIFIIVAFSNVIFLLFVTGKYVLRPHIAYQLAPILYLTIVYYTLSAIRLGPQLSRLLGAFTILIFISYFTKDIIPKYYKMVKLVEDYRSGEVEINHGQGYFDPARYQVNNENGLDIRRQVTSVYPDIINNFYVLGSDPVLYTILESRPYYVFTNYDSSIFSLQNRIVNELMYRNPKYVILNTREMEFDVIPNHIRNPNVYTYLVKNYKFGKRIGSLQVLERGKESTAVKFISLFGNSLDLKRIPSIAAINTVFSKCTTDSCTPILTVNLDSTYDHPAKGGLAFRDSSHNTYNVFFDILPGQNKYNITLENLWFYSFLDISNSNSIQVNFENASYDITYVNKASVTLY